MRALLCALVLLPALSAAAQQSALRQLSASSRGKGRLVIPGQGSYDVTGVEVYFVASGNGRITLQGERPRSIAGRWRRISDREYRLDIHSGLGAQSATGEIRVFVDDDRRLRSVDGSGTAAGRGFKLSFDAGGWGGGGGGGWTSLSRKADGEGTIRRDRDAPLGVDNVSVDLSRNGQAVIRFRGQGVREFTGTWRKQDANTVALTITSGFDTARIDGSGTIELGGRDGIRTVSFNGRQGAARFEVSFTAGGGGGDRPFEGIDTSVVGRGEFEIEGRRDFLNEVRVRLRPGGQAEITLRQPNRERTLTGTWRQQDRNTIPVTLNGGLRAPTSGSATVGLEKGTTLRSVDGSGRANGRVFNFSFRPAH